MNITQHPSPNFDERTLPISRLVLHYTGMETGEAALARLCDREAKVSAHYVIHEDGHIIQLVDEAARAWHAGVSEWAGERNINSASIGVEIINGGHNFPKADGSLPEYAEPQIKALITLCQDILARHKLGPLALLGHSDIAPERKIDPGEHFPWEVLSASGLGIWPENISSDRRVLFALGSRDRGVAIVQRGLAHIGYGARVTGVMDETTQLIIAALQRRFRPDQIDGQVDIQTMELIKWWAELTSYHL